MKIRHGLRVMLCGLLAIAMLAGCAPQTKAPDSSAAPQTPEAPAINLKAGEYTTSTYGHNGTLVLKVTFSEHAIDTIEVVDSKETEAISAPVFTQLIPSIIENQSVAIDAISGATVTSNAVLTGVSDAIVMAGGNPADFAKVLEDNAPAKTVEMTADVVVIGSGAAGLSAAIEARNAGASVIVLEKLAHIGGNTYISGGFVYGTGSEYQKSKGFTDDTPEALAAYWQERAEGKATQAFLDVAAKNSGETIDFLVEAGVEFGDPIVTGTSPVLRGLRSPTGGVGVILPIEARARALGAEIVLNTEATDLIVENGAVVGVQAVSGKDTVIVHARAVVLATGGYDADPDMLAKYSPDIAGQLSRSSPGNVGDGIVMAEKIGAATVFQGGAIGTTAVPGLGYRDPINIRFANVLAVTAEGERYVNEGIDYPLYHRAMTDTKSGAFYQVFDATLNPDGLENAITSGAAFKGDTLEALAAAADIPADALKASVERYNALCAKGTDDDFGKKGELMVAIKEAPFYALKLAPVTIGSLGGVKIDLDTHVLDTDNTPIPGFFAAGAVANGEMFYHIYPSSGSSVNMCFTFGRMAGTNAAEFAAQK